MRSKQCEMGFLDKDELPCYDPAHHSAVVKNTCDITNHDKEILRMCDGHFESLETRARNMTVMIDCPRCGDPIKIRLRRNRL